MLVLPGSVWVRSKYGLLPQGVDVHIRLIGNAKLAVVVSVNGFYLYRPFHQLARPTWFVILTSTILASTESEFQASRISLSTKCRLLIGQGVRRTGLFLKDRFTYFNSAKFDICSSRENRDSLPDNLKVLVASEGEAALWYSKTSSSCRQPGTGRTLGVK